MTNDYARLRNSQQLTSFVQCLNERLHGRLGRVHSVNAVFYPHLAPARPKIELCAAQVYSSMVLVCCVGVSNLLKFFSITTTPPLTIDYLPTTFTMTNDEARLRNSQHLTSNVQCLNERLHGRLGCVHSVNAEFYPHLHMPDQR
jgi:hypothetical protein